jgi:amino acid permease
VDIDTLSADEIREKSFFYSVIPEDDCKGPTARSTKTNSFFSYLSIIKTIVGVGGLGFPRVMREWGVATALALLVLFVLFTHAGTVLLLRAKNLSRHSNLSTIARHTIANKSLVFYSHLAVLFNNLGICVAELTIFGEIVQNIIYKEFPDSYDKYWYLSIWFTSLVILFLIGPMFFIRRIQRLRFLSLIGISAIALFLVSEITLFVQTDTKF